MRRSEVLRSVWPSAIVGGIFMVASDLVGLTTYLPGIAEPAGYHAVTSGLILWALTLLFVGLIGVYARLAKREVYRKRPKPASSSRSKLTRQRARAARNAEMIVGDRRLF